jgi:putative transposase
VLEQAFRKRKRKRGIGAVGKSWRLDETYIKIGGKDRYWYRAVDKQGNTVDFLLTAKRDGRAARRFFKRAVKNNRLPKIVNIDKSGANNAGIKDYNRKHRTKVVIRQCKYLNNIVERDHRAVKRITRPIQGFKDLRCARIILGGVELKPNRGVPTFAPLTRQNRMLTCPDRDARHRILGDNDRDAGNFAEQRIKSTQQRAASGQDHPAIDEIGR